MSFVVMSIECIISQLHLKQTMLVAIWFDTILFLAFYHNTYKREKQKEDGVITEEDFIFLIPKTTLSLRTVCEI